MSIPRTHNRQSLASRQLLIRITDNHMVTDKHRNETSESLLVKHPTAIMIKNVAFADHAHHCMVQFQTWLISTSIC
jgi:hypothetical protein